MQTSFTAEQLQDPATRASEKVIRTCVHCGFCTATCPTYVLLGDELDSPRGRIYLMKQMLEGGETPTPDVVKHIDRCLSCLSCMTTCPSGVHYMHLVDHARAHIEKTYTRPFRDRLTRWLLAKVLPYPGRLRAALATAWLAKPFAPLLTAFGFRPLAAMLQLAPSATPAAQVRRTLYPAEGERKGRVALLLGCANQVLGAHINDATIRVLNRKGIEVVTPADEGCCGALVHHMGHHDPAMRLARANIEAWHAEIAGEGLDAVVVNTSGCSRL